MKTKKEIIEFAKNELLMNNSLVIATLGNGGAGLYFMQGQDDGYISNFVDELNGYSFDGLVDACADIKESESYSEDCEVYQFCDNNGYKLQIMTF